MRRNINSKAVNNAVMQTLESRRLMSAGALDPTFGSGGVVQNGPANPNFFTGDATVSLTNNDLLVAGSAETDGVTGIYIQRYAPDGSVDNSFAANEGYQGQSGYIFLAGAQTVRGMQIDSSGRIVIETSDTAYSSNTHISFYRFNSTGTPDKTFGTNGETTPAAFPSLNTSNLSFPAFAVDDKARIVISTGAQVARYTPQGTADSSFGTSGVVAVNVNVQSVSFQVDGKVLLGTTTAVGQVLVEPSVERLNASGTVDLSFGNHGIAVSDVPVPSVPTFDPAALNEPVAHTDVVTELSNGTIAITGMEANVGGGVHGLAEPQRLFVAEFASSGAVVSGFGSQGAVLTDIDPATADAAKIVNPQAIFAQTDGSLLVAGSYDPSDGMGGAGPSEVFITHYLAGGVLDSNFGKGGTLLYADNSMQGYPSDTPTMAGTDITFSVDNPNAVTGTYPTPDFELLKFNTAGNSALIVPPDGVLTVTGTEEDDNILVQFSIGESGTTPAIDVTVNGVTQVYEWSAVNSIVINSLDGNDQIDLEAAASDSANFPAISITSGNGNDLFTDDLDSYYAAADSHVTISAGNGNDAFVLEGSDDVVTITAGNGNDIFNAPSIAGGDGVLTANVTAGDGANTLTAGNAGAGAEYITFSTGAGINHIYNQFPNNQVITNVAGHSLTIAPKQVEVSGLVYYDTNRDGVYEPGEPTVPNKFVEIVSSTDGYSYGGTETGEDGTYNTVFALNANTSSATTIVGQDTLSQEQGELITGVDIAQPLLLTYFTGTMIGTIGSYENQGNTAANAFDGNLATFFDAPTASGAYVGLDLGAAQIITQVTFTPRYGFASRMLGGVFQASNSVTFSGTVVNLYTVTLSPVVNSMTNVWINNSVPYRYVRYVGPANSYCNIAELSFSGITPSGLPGSVIGSSGSYQTLGNTISNVFDGNFSTYFDAPVASGDWVGLDLGSPQLVTQVDVAPRAGFASRMVGGEIQASNSSDFSTGVVTLYTITTAPPVGTLTTVTLNNAAAFTYYRYIGPAGSYCNIAELNFEG